MGSRKPVKVRMLGEELCLFRGAQGDVVAIQDVCPHRGARLSEGDCHYRGTVACPYHGWVFDESGKNRPLSILQLDYIAQRKLEAAVVVACIIMFISLVGALVARRFGLRGNLG